LKRKIRQFLIVVSGKCNCRYTTEADDVVLSEWNAVLTDMYGDSDELKSALYQIALNDDKVSDVAKQWIKTLIKY